MMVHEPRRRRFRRHSHTASQDFCVCVCADGAVFRRPRLGKKGFRRSRRKLFESFLFAANPGLACSYNITFTFTSLLALYY